MKLKWILKYINKKSPHIVVKMTSDLGLIVCSKMTNIETAAMWVESNISIWATCTILCHLHVKFGNQLQVQLDQISILSNITRKIEPIFEEFNYNKKGKDEKEVWYMSNRDL